MRNRLVVGAMLALPFAYLLVLYAYPIGSVVWMSLRQVEPAYGTDDFVGLDNFREIFAREGWPTVLRTFLYTGVCVLSPRLLPRIPSGERSLVADLWQPLLVERREEIGWVFHDGPFSDLGTPRDFLRATRQALTRGGPFLSAGGKFDPKTRVLSLSRSRGFEAVSSVIGRTSIGVGARLIESAVWDGVEIGAGAELKTCIAAGGRIPAGAVFRDALLWPGPDGLAAAHPLS